jgi:hypothetical protein
MDKMLVRLAKPDECDALTALAMRAKASWGYPDDFMAACRPELTMTQAKMAAWTIWVAQSDQTICGMIALNLKLGSDKIEHQGIDCVPVGLASCGTIYWHYFGSQLWPPGSLPRARGWYFPSPPSLRRC